MAVSNQPWPRYQTYPTWDIPLNTDAGPDNLTGVNINTFVMIFHPANGADTIGTGTFSVRANSPAEIYYKPSIADVANVFTGWLIIRAYFPPSNSATDEVEFDGIQFNITDV